ncbi:MAG: class II fructose-bisphosphatase [Parcubacteria group bacterium]|nr:class II fructose-bisphosphatase [Parcubacteria group bacterium]
MKQDSSVFHHLALDFVSVTEQAAIAAAGWVGKGDGKAADQVAVNAMRSAMNEIDFHGTIVIGEGAKDEAAELYLGEELGRGASPMLDIAVDPLECTDSVAYGRSNATTVLAFGPKGSLYKAADSYMQKIAVGREARGVIDIDAPTGVNTKKVAKALGKSVGEITVAILDRPRHEKLIEEVREAGARVQLFTDGDVAYAIATCFRESPIDMLLGIGGSTEAVLAAAAMKSLGGELLCRWQPKDEKHVARLNLAGVTNFKKIFSVSDLVKGDDIAFIATGVLDGPLASGVNFTGDHIHTETLLLSTKPRLMRHIRTKHAKLNPKSEARNSKQS